jgi:hypothetical protein
MDALASCLLHRQQLRPGKAVVHYGFPSLQFLGELDREQEHFPNANVTVLGGCCIEPESPRSEPVFYCRECRRLRRQARADHVC